MKTPRTQRAMKYAERWFVLQQWVEGGDGHITELSNKLRFYIRCQIADAWMRGFKAGRAIGDLRK